MKEHWRWLRKLNSHWFRDRRIAACRRLLAKTKRSRADAQQYFADLRATLGTCRIKGAVREALDWRMELDCDRGGGAALLLSLRDHDPAALDDYRVASAGRGCPRR